MGLGLYRQPLPLVTDQAHNGVFVQCLAAVQEGKLHDDGAAGNDSFLLMYQFSDGRCCAPSRDQVIYDQVAATGFDRVGVYL